MDIGLIQIVVKPLFRLGLDILILVILCDTRHNIFDCSLLMALFIVIVIIISQEI